MNKFLIICDRLMYGSLLALIFFLPYSLALISVCQGIMAGTWVVNRILIFKASPSRSCAQGFKLTSSSMFWPLIAIGLLIALMIPFNHHPALGFKKLCTRFLYQILLMCLVTQVVRSRKRLYSVLTVLLLMVFFVSATALVKYLGAHNFIHHTLLVARVSGPMHHANDLGTLLVAVLPVVVVLMVNCRRWMSPLVLFSFLILVSTLGLTSSRGAWLAFGVSMIALTFFLKNRKLTVSIVLLLIMFFWAFGMYCLSTRIDLYDVPMTQGPVMKPSFSNPWGLPAPYHALNLFFGPSGRGFYWDTAIDVIKKYPWFGCGYNTYTQTLKDLNVGHTEYPHNSLLHITAELGITGLLFYLWLFAALCVQGWKILRAVSSERDLYVLGCGISCGILAWMVHSLLDTPWSSLQLGILLWLLIGILLSLGFILPKEGERKCP